MGRFQSPAVPHRDFDGNACQVVKPWLFISFVDFVKSAVRNHGRKVVSRSVHTVDSVNRNIQYPRRKVMYTISYPIP